MPGADEYGLGESSDATMPGEVASALFSSHAFERGRQAFRDGDLRLADFMLRVAYGHQASDSVVYLTALHQRLGHPEVAAAWWTLAQFDGWIQEDLNKVLAVDPR